MTAGSQKQEPSYATKSRDIVPSSSRRIRKPAVDRDTTYDVPLTPPRDSSPANRVGEQEVEEKGDRQLKDNQICECSFKSFVEHRWMDNSIEIRVEWDDGDMTWEPEANLHEDALETLLTYWKNQRGRPTNPEASYMYDIFAIRRHSKDRKRLFVEWVDYGPDDMTWVLRSSVERTAPEMVSQYWDEVKSRRRNQRVRRR